MPSYDTVLIQNGTNDSNEYGIIHGNNKIVLIKAGANGSYRGYNDRYLLMADWLHKNYGCTVICASNPDKNSFAAADRAVISRYIAEHHPEPCEYSYFGVSNGAYQGLVIATEYFQFKKMVMVNMPLFLNWHKIKNKLTEHAPLSITMVYGDRDPSFPYLPLLDRYRSETLDIRIIEGADHRFSERQEAFINLRELI